MSEYTGIDVPPNFYQGHMGAMLAGVERRSQHSDMAMARHTDTALHGLKVIESIAAYELLVSNDPDRMAATNAGVRIPTSISHPSMLGPGVSTS